MQLDNTITATHFNLAKVHRSVGDARIAEHFFKNVLILDPTKSRAHFELAELYRSEGHAAEALLEYRAAIEAESSSERVRNQDELERLSTWMTNLGSLLRECGTTLEALELLDRAIALNEGNGLARFELARCLHELCREEKAQNEFSRSIATLIAPGGADVEIVMARIVGARDGCTESGMDYVELAKPQWLAAPQPRTIPEIDMGWAKGSAPVAPRLYLAKFVDATILPAPNAILVRKRALVVEGVVNMPHQYPQTSFNVLHAADDLRVALRIPRESVQIDGGAVFLGSASDHFSGLYECLGRMWLIDQDAGLRNVRIVMGTWVASTFEPIFGMFGIEVDRVVRLDAGSQTHLDELVVPSLPLIGPWIAPVVLQYVRRRLMVAPQLKNRKIFISGKLRGESRLRNEEELTSILSSSGIEVLDCKRLTLVELICALQESALILSSDVDCLAYAAVAPQGVRIALIGPQGGIDIRLQFVAQPLGHKLTFLVATPDFGSDERLDNCEMTLDPGILRRYLHSIGER